MGASATLVMAGAGCLIMTIFMLRLVLPREGKAPSAWTRTEMRAMGTAVLVMVLLIAGVVMLAKAFL
jgi:hypothetical protein